MYVHRYVCVCAYICALERLAVCTFTDLKQKMSNFVIYYPNPVSVSESFGCLDSVGVEALP